ncbi:MAG: endolytic transglycosylase MltG [Clostridia bacterium]|jgi:hypothetical protein|nr:endolytic transglycosylase MltG [Clostridia bacterium]
MGVLRTKNNLYLILGLGIGIIVSSLFFLLFPTNKALTNQEIILRAAELSMEREQIFEPASNQLEMLQQWVNYPKIYPEKTNEIITVTIPAGANSSQIGKMLADNGVISSIETFQILVDVFSVEKKFIAGVYQLQHHMDIGELILMLTGIKK